MTIKSRHKCAANRADLVDIEIAGCFTRVRHVTGHSEALLQPTDFLQQLNTLSKHVVDTSIPTQYTQTTMSNTDTRTHTNQAQDLIVNPCDST